MESDHFIPRQLRSSVPGEGDIAPYGTQVEVLFDDDVSFIFIQVGSEFEPRWERLGNILEKAFMHNFNDPKFFDQVLTLYEKYMSRCKEWRITVDIN